MNCRRFPVTSGLLLPCCAAALLAGCSGDNQRSGEGQNLYVVGREDLPLTVKENAELQAISQTVVRSEVEGNSTLIYLIEEGTMVKEGDKLFELDVSQLVEKRASQEISVERAKSEWEQARTQQAILEKELTTKRNTAASQLKIAEMDLEKFLGAKASATSAGRNGDMVQRLRDLIMTPIESEATPGNGGEGTGPQVTKVDPRSYADLVAKVIALLTVPDPENPDAPPPDPLAREMGKMANDVLQQSDQIRLAMAQLKLAEETVHHSRRLAAKNFITRNELERDELDYQSQESRVTIAWKDLELLINYTLPTQLIQLQQDLDNARLELERVDAQNEAERKKSEFDVEAKEKEYIVAKERFENLVRQVDHAICLAPTPGVVVYARLDRGRRGGETVSEGAQVRDRQEIIILPDNTRMRCDVKVQEAQIDRVAIGQPAHITVEAFPNEVFTGHVTRVAPVADSNSSWGGSDKKVYTTIVDLDGVNTDGRLRARMAAAVTITVGNIENALAVPQQAVRRDRSVMYVWKKTRSGPEAVRVKVGVSNQAKVEILDGLVEGDVVYRTPPRDQPAPKFEQPALPEGAGIPSAAAPGPGAAGQGGTEDEGPGRRLPGAGRDEGDEGGQRPPRGGRGARKSFAEMTPEELEQYKSRLDRMAGMADRIPDADAAASYRATLGQLRTALDEGDLAAAQRHADALRVALMGAMRRGGGPGGDRNEGPGGGRNGGGR